jgi:hypothetical protein
MLHNRSQMKRFSLSKDFHVVNFWNRMIMSVAKHNSVEATKVNSELLWVASVEPKIFYQSDLARPTQSLMANIH